MSPAIRIKRAAAELVTEGLTSVGCPEIALPLVGSTPPDEAAELLEVIARYVSGGARIEAGQTLGYGYWHVRFERDAAGRLGIHELPAELGAYVPGAELTLTYWRTQQAICRRHQAPFTPPRPDQLAAISSGVLEGGRVDAVRYRAPPHMSGWYVWTPEWNNDVQSMRVEHLHHLTARRPDLAGYLALPPGFRVHGGSLPAVEFDEAVAAAPEE
jgi:hypothetical protein